MKAVRKTICDHTIVQIPIVVINVIVVLIVTFIILDSSKNHSNFHLSFLSDKILGFDSLQKAADITDHTLIFQ